MKLDTTDFERKMKKSIEIYQSSLETIRVGRASAAVLNNVTFDYYGVPTPIQQMAEIKVPDPKTLVIAPWDATTVKAIERAILASDVGITPQNDGKVLRLIFPPLTEERRKELSKQVSKMGEEAKVNVRNIRRDGIDKAKNMKKNGDMTEDEQKESEKLMQDLTDKYVKQVDEITSAKEKDIMSM
ncbi:MAG: ribosome recycling factor [Clostridia bacterium]|nr:ribosome recycling factor [Clostridia bacterium]MBQ3900597.1 ribosome recycling factor [Clostridia bacterium]